MITLCTSFLVSLNESVRRKIGHVEMKPVHCGYYIFVTTVVLGMGIIYEKILFFMLFQSKAGTKKSQ